MLMNKKWTAIALGLVLVVSGSVFGFSHVESNENTAINNTPMQTVRALSSEALISEGLVKEWQQLKIDFQEIIDLDSSGDVESAMEKWETLIPEVDKKLGIVFDTTPMSQSEPIEEVSQDGWTGYINTFVGLIENQDTFDQLIDFAGDIDALSSQSPMMEKLEAEIALLLEEALDSVDLTEVEGVFLEPSELEGVLTEEELGSYTQLLDAYVQDENESDFKSAQDNYDAIIELLNDYPELTQENQGELYAQFKVINEKLSLVEKPVDEEGMALEIKDNTKEDLKKYELLWQYVIKLMPDTATDYVEKFEVGTDGRDGTMAFVYPVTEAGKKFVLNLDIKDMIGEDGKYMKKDMNETIVHEFAHILSLNHTQLSSNAVGTYQTQEGILTKNSYLNNFYSDFWANKTDAYLLSNEDGYRQYDVDKLYGDHASWFVSDYAATNVEEDIAESFRIFVLEDKASGNSVKDQKINFFYQYPELVKMRDDIRGNTK